MKAIKPKHIASILILFAFCLVNTTCKRKIEKHPFDMAGVWYSSNVLCGFVLVIQNNSSGELICTGGKLCDEGKTSEDKIKFNKKYMLINDHKYYFIDGPKSTLALNDSISAPEENDLLGDRRKLFKKLATMTLRYEKYETMLFNKYINY